MRLLVLVALLVFSATPARAVLLELDLFAPGDALVTRDTASGLDWLELTLTTSASFEDVAAGAGGWTSAGWRHATAAELCGLVEGDGTLTSACPQTAALAGSGLRILQIAQLLGSTSSGGGGGFGGGSTGASGFYDDGDASDGFVGWGSFALGGSPLPTFTAFVRDDVWEIDRTSASLGHYLVRASVPEPSAAFLCALATAAGLAAVRRRMP